LVNRMLSKAPPSVKEGETAGRRPSATSFP
jgi:hypothetical protein